MIGAAVGRRIAAALLGSALVLSGGVPGIACAGPEVSSSGSDPAPPASPPPTGEAGTSSPGRLYGLRQIRADARFLASRPFHLDRRGGIKVAAAAGTAGLLYLMRNRIRDWSQDHRSPGRDRFLQDVRVMGKGAFAPSLAAVAYGVSYLTREEREKETAVLLLESMGFTALGIGSGQFVLASQRPADGDEVHFFRRGGHGFSGDAGLAASVVAPLRRQYLAVRTGDSRAIRFWKWGGAGILYAGAALTAYQRVNNDRHWAPDAFLGMATGLAVGGALCDSHDDAKRKRGRLTLETAPVGAILRIRF